MNTDVILSCKDISKNFKGVCALDGVDFDIFRGKVHGLIGENGAGKSTLMKIISGAYKGDAGEMFLDGELLVLNHTEDAIANRIITIHQDSDLISTLSVAENIFLNHEPRRKVTGLIDNRKMMEKAESLLASFDININVRTKVKELPNDIQKMVQIVKAISHEADILLMDEPTSALTGNEVGLLLDFVRNLASKNIGIVFISHYISEVFSVCDMITVLRDGKVVGTFDKKETGIDEVVHKMIGRSIDEDIAPPAGSDNREEVFSVKNLQVKAKLHDISFSLCRGEILGITGLIGSGTTELAKVLFRSEDVRLESGEYKISGEAADIRDTKGALDRKIAFVPSDRKNEGLFAKFSIRDNVCLPSINSFRGRLNLIDNNKMNEVSREYIDLLSIKTPSCHASVQNLSGGNQQKVLLAKWLMTKPEILILDEPTIGIDIGTKHEIRKLILGMAESGISVILITSELEELEKLCSRVLVMFRGRIVSELTGKLINKKEILKAAMGGNKNDAIG